MSEPLAPPWPTPYIADAKEFVRYRNRWRRQIDDAAARVHARLAEIVAEVSVEFPQVEIGATLFDHDAKVGVSVRGRGIQTKVSAFPIQGFDDEELRYFVRGIIDGKA